jgi:hypothetical protein
MEEIRIRSFKNKIISLFVAVLLLTSTIAVLTVNSTNAQDMSVHVQAYLSARPRTIGIGQELLMNFWVTPAPGANRQYHDYTIKVTDPDGKSESFTMDSYVADGTNWCPWVFDRVGDWKIDFYYPGEYFEPGRYYEGEIVDSGGTVYADGALISSSSARTLTITVQSDIVPGWPGSPLPTGYWTRPVNEENREWWPILGSYPWFGNDRGFSPGIADMWNEIYPNTNPTYNSAYGFVPWVSAPESAHIVWKRTYQMGGLMGGDWGQASSVGPSISGWGMRPDLIVMGRAYHTVTRPGVASPSGQTYWQCYDIRTGDIIWERALFPGETAPNLIEYGTDAPGVVAATQLKPAMPTLLSISNGYLRRYNANTGALVANISIAPMTGNGGTYYKNGYVLGIQDLGADAGAERYRLINWTTIGTSANFESRVISNTTYQRSSLPSAQLTDWNVGLAGVVTNLQSGGMFIGMRVEGVDLMTGTTLWSKEIPEQFYSASANVADHGQLAIVCADGYYLAYDLSTGRETWKTRSLDYPWDEPGWGSYSVTSAYGNLYWVAQTGIYSIDWTNGHINWKYEKAAPPFETPYINSEGETVYPFMAAALIADGKIYAYSSEHTPETPFYRGCPTVCVDAITGEEIWSIGMTGAGEFARSATQLAIADGYMTFGARDGVMYTFGMGLSETTVSAPQLPLALGQKVFLTGTVFDLSPAQPNTPCVSKESMAAQMEYLHMQTQIGGVHGNVTMTGVPVLLTAVDPHGTSIEIATVTSDGYSGTFGYAWKPDIPGEYTITATFMGDESYDSSFATTYLTVAEGSGNGNTSNSDTNNTVLYVLIGATAAIIVTIVLVGFIFRKK